MVYLRISNEVAKLVIHVYRLKKLDVPANLNSKLIKKIYNSINIKN
jgi:hypothetical protein